MDGIIALFAGDAWLTMPPAPLEYQGRELIARFLKTIAFRDGRTYDLVPTRANGQLAFGAYLREAREQDAQANGLLVLTLRGSRIEAMTRFMNSVLASACRPVSRAAVSIWRRSRDDRETIMTAPTITPSRSTSARPGAVSRP